MAAGQRRARLTVRVLAVDWSGKADGGRETIWLAEIRDGMLVRLENGRSREEVVEHLLEVAAGGEPVVAGLDFAFSLPEWWVREMGCASAEALWAKMAEGLAEKILARCEAPFWGRPGKKRPACEEPLRRTDKVSVGAKSVFQIGGAGAVGTGSLRGMPALHRLRDRGLAVWPFTAAGQATIVEIYPRALTGPVNKSSEEQRARYLSRWQEMPARARASAAGSEDAFDAVVSALVMWAHRDELGRLPPARDEVERLEGSIWLPSCAGGTTCSAAGCARAGASEGSGAVHLDALLRLPEAERAAAARALLESLTDRGATSIPAPSNDKRRRRP